MQLPSSVSTRLQYQHKSLLDLIDGLSDEEIRLHIVPGKWSIFEQIVHLETYQHTFIKRIKLMLEGNTPVFEKYSAETDPLFHDHCHLSSREVMQNLLSLRKEMSAGILAFTETDLQKKGIHPVYGEFTLPQWLNFFLLHEAHHLFCIFKLACQVTMEKRRGA
jgi:uncharacterized damage-inducible protein DinB